jgi:DNA recombination protein RmuC
MREAADHIRDEVGRLMKDVSLLGDRIRKLQGHFNQSTEDIRQSIISIEKIESRGERIAHVEFNGAADDAPALSAPVRKLQAGE